MSLVNVKEGVPTAPLPNWRMAVLICEAPSISPKFIVIVWPSILISPPIVKPDESINEVPQTLESISSLTISLLLFKTSTVLSVPAGTPLKLKVFD